MSEETTTTEERSRRKVLSGIVVSDKMDKTIVVMVEDRVKHPLYGKVMTKSSRQEAPHENNHPRPRDPRGGSDTRTRSAPKRWRLVEIIERAK